MKIKKGDTVKVLIGKDKGKEGKIEKIYPKGNRVLILGVNEYKRHVKSRARNQKSEIITITKPLPVSNVAILCPKCKKPTRVGFRIEKDKKIRVCAKCRKDID
ncbi:MAG: 50S ribosomal protein L24 [Candidatus Levybacteria bacterium RIFCSPHIGHO2_01_FULL_40_15b]|nr:MAG: 50S ribosomal protein L24 [Candidatus Levybacteria bacterium RIFCSPHIGHO2_01_FULL_40_15b]